MLNSNRSLEIMSPSLNAIGILGIFSQGIGSADNLTLAELKENLDTAQDDEKNNALIKINKVITKSIVSGIVTNVLAVIILAVAREPIVNFFIYRSTADVRANAQTVLWITGLGLIVDSPRIISATLLNPWNKILLPNMISLGLMTAIGTTLSYLLSMGKDEKTAVIMMFSIRAAMILLAAVINTSILYRCVSAEKKKINLFSQDRENHTASINDERCENNARIAEINAVLQNYMA